MNEVKQNNPKSPNCRALLFASASALGLGTVFPNLLFAAEDEGRPTVWIELGGQLERLENGRESFAPQFVSQLLQNPFTPPARVQEAARYSTGEQGKISFAPVDSDWIMSIAVRYGRSNRAKSTYEGTSPGSAQQIVSIPASNFYRTKYQPAAANRFASTSSTQRDSHLVLDFLAGKDVGLGLFGNHSTSSVSAGLRFAQFTSRSTTKIESDPNFTISYKYPTEFRGYAGFFKLPSQSWDVYSAKSVVSRSFHGVGPSMEWNADADLFGNPEVGSVTFDWGLSGAVLFGRQKMQASHTTAAHHGTFFMSRPPIPTLYPTRVHSTSRSKAVVVPNVGGYAGISVRLPNAKLSLGYRVDAFFGAIDGGIDAPKSYDRDFYGPFATISIGLGD